MFMRNYQAEFMESEVRKEGSVLLWSYQRKTRWIWGNDAVDMSLPVRPGVWEAVKRLFHPADLYGLGSPTLLHSGSCCGSYMGQII